MKCPQCGAAMEAPAAEASRRCPYCDTVVEGPRAADPFESLFADRDGNGIPDGIEAMLKQPGSVGVHPSSASYTVNGVRYERLEDVPAEMRDLLEKAQGLLGGMSGRTDLPEPARQARRDDPGSADPKRSPAWIALAVILAFLAGIACVVLIF